MDPRPDPVLQALQQRLGYRFGQPELLRRALTHRSWGAEHNERLEFLGDAVLSLAVSGLLFERLPDSDEGDLTRVRAHLVREDSLHRAALALGLPEDLRLSEGEARGGGAQRPSILADALEAIIGAVFLDGGYEPAQALVQRLFGDVDPGHRGRALEQGRQDRAAGMAAGAHAWRCRHTASSPPAARPMRRPSRSNARCRRWVWPNAAKAVRAALPSRRPRVACSTCSRPATGPAGPLRS